MKNQKKEQSTHVKKLKKEAKTKAGRKKNIIKIRAQINKIENRSSSEHQ